MTKEEAIKNIKEHCYFANLISQAKESLDMAVKALEQEQKIGRWIDAESLDGALWYACSECGETVYYKTNYCPYCGVQMEYEE